MALREFPIRLQKNYSGMLGRWNVLQKWRMVA
jgi:hypothetical protein